MSFVWSMTVWHFFNAPFTLVLHLLFMPATIIVIVYQQTVPTVLIKHLCTITRYIPIDCRTFITLSITKSKRTFIIHSKMQKNTQILLNCFLNSFKQKCLFKTICMINLAIHTYITDMFCTRNFVTWANKADRFNSTSPNTCQGNKRLDVLVLPHLRLLVKVV